MEITRKNWMQYIQNLAKADDKAAELISDYLYDHEIGSDKGFNAFVDFFYSVVTKYAEGASEMAAQAYEALAEVQGATIKSAMPAETPTYGECKKTILGTMLDSDQAKSLAQAAGRLVRRTGVDTTLNNALRDGAEWAWVPSGDTCAFCMMLASNGWQRASKKAIKNGHASHIHANCDCTYAIRFDGKSTVEGYDPDYYKALYDNAEGTRWQDKLNSMRRDKYAQNPEKYREQKRIAYRTRNGGENTISSTLRQEKKSEVFSLKNIDYVPASSIEEAENFAKEHFVKGGFNLTGKEMSYKGIDVDVANRINQRLADIYAEFDIPKLSSLESFGKTNKKLFSQHSDAPMFTSNFGNLGLNNTILKNASAHAEYIAEGKKAFDYVMDNIDKVPAGMEEIAKAYQIAGRGLVGDTIEDMVTHEIGHHISYISEANKILANIQKTTEWKKYAENLSGYANHSFGEYVAESFNAFCKGEQDKLQSEMIELFNNLRKK